jgi:hypothetical protein
MSDDVVVVTASVIVAVVAVRVRRHCHCCPSSTPTRVCAREEEEVVVVEKVAAVVVVWPHRRPLVFARPGEVVVWVEKVGVGWGLNTTVARSTPTVTLQNQYISLLVDIKILI